MASFLGNAPNVQLVNKQLKIGYAQLLHLRHSNGQALTGKRLQAHGLDEITPLEPCFGCTGVPRGPTIDAQLCKQCPGSADANVYHCRVGEKQPHHVLHNDNLFICLPCRRNVERWELNVLEHKERNGPLTEHEENRLVVLRARADNNRVRTNELRKTNVVAKGLEAVQERERAKDRSHRSRQTEDPA